MHATNDFKKGLKIELEGIPFRIIDFQHVSPGKGSAFTRTKLRNMLNGNVVEKTFKSGDKFPAANTEEKEMQFLYKDSEGFHFMDTSSYEQIPLSEKNIGEEGVGYLIEGIKVNVTFFNDRPIGVELPNMVELKVVETDPAFKGDTVTGGTKPAKTEAGAVVQVPFHIKEGDVIKVDTRENKYVTKINK